MKIRFFYIIATVLLSLTGCASTGATSASETPAKMEQAAQLARDEGQIEESSAIYRKLAEMNPTHFNSVLYQHELMLNAMVQSDLRLMLDEMLHTWWLFEKARDEHFEGATPEALEQERKKLGEFFYNFVSCYNQSNDSTIRSQELYFMLIFVCLEILHSDTFKDEYENDLEEIEENIRYLASGFSRANFTKIPDYFDHLFDLYDRGEIIPESMNSLDLIKYDMTKLNINSLDAVSGYVYAFGFRGYKYLDHIDITRAARLNGEVRQYIPCPYKAKHESNGSDADQEYPIPECREKYVDALSRVVRMANSYGSSTDDEILDNACNSSPDKQDPDERDWVLGVFAQKAYVYFEYNHFDQARELAWKMINKCSKSTPKLDFLPWFAIQIIKSYQVTKRYQEMEDSIRIIKQNPDLMNNEKEFGDHLRIIVGNYEKMISTCKEAEQQNRMEDAHRCYANITNYEDKKPGVTFYTY